MNVLATFSGEPLQSVDMTELNPLHTNGSYGEIRFIRIREPNRWTPTVTSLLGPNIVTSHVSTLIVAGAK